MLKQRIRISGLALVAVFALSAVAATGAQAVEGPLYRVPCHKVSAANKEKGAFDKISALGECEELAKIPPLAGEGEYDTRLLAGEEAGIEVEPSDTSTEPRPKQVLKAGTVTNECTGTRVAAGAVLTGSTGANSSGSKETIEYTGCTVTGNGSSCTVVEPIVTKPLVNTEGYSNGARTGPLLTIYEPASGSEYTEIKYTGTGCIVKSAKVKVKSGCTPVACKGVICEDQNEADEAVEVNLREAYAVQQDVSCPSTKIAAIWTEAAGALTERKAGLEVSLLEATYAGESDVKLTSGGSWGVWTK